MRLAQLIAETGEQEAVIQVLCHLLSVNRTNVFLMKEISEPVAKEAKKILKKYQKGTPLPYILGYAYFYNRKFMVTPDVLIPRCDTEVLVELAEKKIIADSVVYGQDQPYKILDLCCGSGVIGISLAYLCKWIEENNPQLSFEVTVADISDQALKVAFENSRLHDVDLRFIRSDLLEGIVGKYDLLVCNPPYVRTQDIGVEDPYVLKEPKLALDGGIDGLYYYRRILADARRVMQRGATMIFEVGFDQAAALQNIALKYGYRKIKVYKDLANRDRVVTIRV